MSEGAMSEPLQRVTVKLEVNGEPRTITVEPRTTLLDALREQLALSGTKKGCWRRRNSITPGFAPRSTAAPAPG